MDKLHSLTRQIKVPLNSIENFLHSLSGFETTTKTNNGDSDVVGLKDKNAKMMN